MKIEIPVSGVVVDRKLLHKTWDEESQRYLPTGVRIWVRYHSDDIEHKPKEEWIGAVTEVFPDLVYSLEKLYTVDFVDVARSGKGENIWEITVVLKKDIHSDEIDTEVEEIDLDSLETTPEPEPEPEEIEEDTSDLAMTKADVIDVVNRAQTNPDSVNIISNKLRENLSPKKKKIKLLSFVVLDEDGNFVGTYDDRDEAQALATQMEDEVREDTGEFQRFQVETKEFFRDGTIHLPKEDRYVPRYELDSYKEMFEKEKY